MQNHDASNQSAVNSTRTKIPSYFTSSQASITYTQADIYLPNKQNSKNKQNQAFLALVAAMRSQIHFPSLHKHSRACLKKDICKIQFSIFQWASKRLIFLNGPSEKGINFWLLAIYSFSYCHFIMHGSTTPAGTLGIHKKQKYESLVGSLYL